MSGVPPVPSLEGTEQRVGMVEQLVEELIVESWSSPAIQPALLDLSVSLGHALVVDGNMAARRQRLPEDSHDALAGEGQEQAEGRGELHLGRGEGEGHGKDQGQAAEDGKVAAAARRQPQSSLGAAHTSYATRPPSSFRGHILA